MNQPQGKGRKELNESPPLILASGSPRRRELLTESGYDFEVHVPDVVEIEDESIEIRELTRLNAQLKANAVANDHPSQVIIAADTLVLFEGKSLGKPADMEDAEEMLSLLNGRTHEVYTGVCLLKQESGKAVEFGVVTSVTFKELSREERRRYHELIEPLDKAGAYGAQDHGHLIIEKSEGSASNVIGLPMEELAAQLRYHFEIEARAAGN